MEEIAVAVEYDRADAILQSFLCYVGTYAGCNLYFRASSSPFDDAATSVLPARSSISWT